MTIPGFSKVMMKQSRKTGREKLWGRLHTKGGRKLEDHPICIVLHELINYNSIQAMQRDNWVRSYGQIDHQLDQIPFVRVSFIDWMQTIMDIVEFNAMLREANEETEQSLTGISNAYNKVNAIHTQLLPTISEMTKSIIQSRITIEREMKQSLDAFHSIRDFFLERSYENEMERLTKYIAVCKQLKALKDDGTLDAVADLAIKLNIASNKE